MSKKLISLILLWIRIRNNAQLKICIKKLGLKFLTFQLIVVLLSCGKDKHDAQNIDAFEKKYRIGLESSILIENLLDPTVIEVLDSLIIISNYKAEPLIEIYTTSGVLVKKMIHKGKGPSEILAVGLIQVSDKNNCFYVNDLFAKKIIRYDLPEILEDEGYKPEIVFNALRYDDEENILYDKVLVGEHFFVAENRSPEGRILLIDKNGKSLGYFLGFPKKEEVNPKLTENANSRLYASAVTLSPDLTKMAMASYSAGMIDLLSLENDYISPIWTYQEFLPTNIEAMPMGSQIVAVHTSKSKSAYLDICATNNYVYALFSGRLAEEKDYAYGNIIRVINWEATEFFELHLDRKIKRLTASLDDKKIYGISKNVSGEPEIIVFDITQPIEITAM